MQKHWYCIWCYWSLCHWCHWFSTLALKLIFMDATGWSGRINVTQKLLLFNGKRIETCSILLIRLFLLCFLFLVQFSSRQIVYRCSASVWFRETCFTERTVSRSATWVTVQNPPRSHCDLNLGTESILDRANVMVYMDTEQRRKGTTMYFTFLYTTPFKTHDLM